MSRWVRFLAALCAFALVALSANSAVAVSTDESLTVSGKQDARVVEVTARFRLINPTADPVKNLRLVVPPTVLTETGSQRVLSVRYSMEPAETRQTPAGVEAVYVLDEVAPGEAVTIEQVYTVALASGARVAVAEEISEEYLAPGASAESDHPLIRAKAAEVTAGVTDVDAQAEAIVRFVSRHIRYNLKAASRNKGGVAGLLSGEGVCSEYAGLFVAMARAFGIPARLVYGWARGSGLQGELKASQRHIWAEYYHPERGWVPVDPTFAAILPKDQVMRFDAEDHLAQDWSQTNISAGYSGRGFLAVKQAYTLAEASVQHQTSRPSVSSAMAESDSAAAR